MFKAQSAVSPTGGHVHDDGDAQMPGSGPSTSFEAFCRNAGMVPGAAASWAAIAQHPRHVLMFSFACFTLAAIAIFSVSVLGVDIASPASIWLFLVPSAVMMFLVPVSMAVLWRYGLGMKGSCVFYVPMYTAFTAGFVHFFATAIVDDSLTPFGQRLPATIAWLICGVCGTTAFYVFNPAAQQLQLSPAAWSLFDPLMYGLSEGLNSLNFLTDLSVTAGFYRMVRTRVFSTTLHAKLQELRAVLSYT